MSSAMNRGTNFGSSLPQPQRRPEHATGNAGLVDSAKETAKNLASGASDLANQAKDKAQDWAGTVADNASEAWDATRDGACDLANRVSDRTGDIINDFGIFVRRYPGASIVAALGVGFCLAQLVNSRHFSSHHARY